MSNSFTKLALGGALLAGIASATGLAILPTTTALAAGGSTVHTVEHKDWSFTGMFGRYDKNQLQRGFQVYKDVCSSCHGLRHIYYRNLSEPGGPEFPVDRVKALAAEAQIPAGPDEDGEIIKDGELIMRKALPSDHYVGPFANENAARSANGGALPVDLSLITRARGLHNDSWFFMVPWNFLRDVTTVYQEDGANYVYGLMTSYHETAPKGVTLNEGMYYNTIFAGQQIAMPPPLSADNFITYADGTGSLEKNAEDVTAFLAWAANPELNARKSLGFRVMLYLLIMSILLYIAKRRVWARLKH